MRFINGSLKIFFIIVVTGEKQGDGNKNKWLLLSWDKIKVYNNPLHFPFYLNFKNKPNILNVINESEYENVIVFCLTNNIKYSSTEK